MAFINRNECKGETPTNEMTKGQKRSLRKNEKEILQRLKDEIKANPAGDYTIQRLSVRLSMDRNKLYYGFKKFSRKSIHQFIITQKIKGAKQLLRESNMPIKAIARECGYKSVKNFHTAFKKQTGKTPLAYKKAK